MTTINSFFKFAFFNKTQFMKTIKALSFGILFLTFMACGDDDPISATNCSTTYNQEFQDELNTISSTLSAYGQDQSVANCQALKNAYLVYIDELEKWEDCATVNWTVADYNQALDSSRESINALVC